jgi:hypothetical protein
MCCRRQCSLHHIYASWVNNDNVNQSPEAISSDKDIHLSFGVGKEKVEDLPLNMCFTFQSNNYDNILKCVVGCYTLVPTGALKQMGTRSLMV